MGKGYDFERERRIFACAVFGDDFGKAPPGFVILCITGYKSARLLAVPQVLSSTTCYYIICITSVRGVAVCIT